MKKLVFLFGFMLLFAIHFSFGQNDSAGIADKNSEGIDSVKRNKIKIYPGFGISLIRNELAPVFYINLGVNHRDRYEVNINTSSIFFFEREADKNYNIFRNTFLNAEFLLNFSLLNGSVKNWNGLGIGYLVESKGQYFRDATVFLYYKRKYRYLSIMPGIMLADDFKDVFPVISIRL
ncbi:MAG: hypothetical protein IPP71_17690 [Bacteroidetes bacterium]|nr:hypothetical protein [Bacteroidota bacterium]